MDTTSKGSAIFFDKNINNKIINYETDKSGRYLFINVEIGKHILSLINVYTYAPNDPHERNSFLRNINKIITYFAVGIKVFSGEFNNTL